MFSASHNRLEQKERLKIMKSERANIVFTAPAKMPFAIDWLGMHRILQINYARNYSLAPAALKKSFWAQHIKPIANNLTQARRAYSIHRHPRLDLMGYGSMYSVHKPVQHAYSRVACVDQSELLTALSSKRLLEELEPGVLRDQTLLLLTDFSSHRPKGAIFPMAMKPTQYRHGRGYRSVTPAASLVPVQGMALLECAGVEPTGKSTCQRITAASVQA